jgi:hypothetical protein
MASAFLMASSMGMAQAQSSGDEATAQQGQRMAQSQQGERMMQQGMQRGQRMMQEGMQRGQRMSQRGMQRGQRGYGRYRDGRPGMMRQHRRVGDGMGMMQGMGHGVMMQVLFAIMDADGDGALSLEEVQEAHARIFAHMDADGDGLVTKEEIRAFFRAGMPRRGWGAWDGPDDSDNDMDDSDE